MLMDPTDLSDITGGGYTFLIHGHGPGDNWTGLFKPGERVRLRIINTAAQTDFGVRIPVLKSTVVAAGGQAVPAGEADGFQIGDTRTYDGIGRATEGHAFSLPAS